MLHQHVKGNLYLRVRALAREMRKQPTDAEDFFWEKVRDRRLFGLKWNRQHIIHCHIYPVYTKYYIADYHSHGHKLLVELDGQIHLKQKEQDLLRTDHMIERGFTVLRFTNDMVLNHWNEVEKIIWEYIFR